jgi:hypothetical protein
MVWTSDVTVDVLDLLSFFLAAPDLIGKSRLDEFERNIGGVLTRSLLAGPWARAKIRILRQWAWRIFAHYHHLRGSRVDFAMGVP